MEKVTKSHAFMFILNAHFLQIGKQNTVHLSYLGVGVAKTGVV